MSVLLHGDVVAAEAEASGEKKWSQLFPWGKRYRADYPGGVIEYGAELFQAFIDSWQRNGKQPLPIDYFHRGASRDGDGNPLDDKVAAGWIHDVRVENGVGMHALIEWTPRGRGYIEAKELRYLSPVFHPAAIDPITNKRGPRLFGAGLLNDPFFTDMPEVAASALPTTKLENRMEKKLVCAAFGMPEDTADETLYEMMRDAVKARTQAQALEASVMPLQQKASAAEELRHAAVAEAAALKAQVAQYQAQAKAAQVDAFMLKHAAKVPPATAAAVRAQVEAVGVAAAEAFYQAMPTVAPATGVVGFSSVADGAIKGDLSDLSEAAAKHKAANASLNDYAAYRKAYAAAKGGV